MKLLRFNHPQDSRPRIGVAVEDGVIDVTASVQSALGADDLTPEVLRRGGELAAAVAGTGGDPLPLDGITIAPPLPGFARNLFAIGRNYATHVLEGARARGVAPELPTKPVIFTKAPSTVIAAGETVVIDTTATQKPDYEGELCIVIGRDGANITHDEAMSYVFGYTIANDVSARDAQFEHVQWFKGKNFDTFCPLGPWIVTADELDPSNIQVTTRVNGETRQDDNTKNFIFDVATVIVELSRGLTLRAGDVILTGTPEGVGFAMDPPRFLADGDVVEVEIEGIGVLSNPVRLAGAR